MGDTGLVAAASALDRSVGIFQTWRDGFQWICVNYPAATFLSGFLTQVVKPVTLTEVATVVAGCAVIYAGARMHVRLAGEVHH